MFVSWSTSTQTKYSLRKGSEISKLILRLSSLCRVKRGYHVRRGAPERTRTSNRQIRNLVFCPIELQAQKLLLIISYFINAA